uniref:hypothetical protein n=1 Tax=Vibrio sp. 1288 TaxID=3074550 RepID=UPI00296695A9|nr:hypothetical protein [Vibrio sp. 1288]MDW3137054.1 hypothetical protein [Vibrio sp. 1288]
MSRSFPDLLISFEEAVEALKVKLSQDPASSTIYNGEYIQSLAKDIEDRWAAISAMVKGRASFETKADLLASGAPPAGQLLAEVWRDSTLTNNGLYGWTGSAWEKSNYDAVEVLGERITAEEEQTVNFKTLIDLDDEPYLEITAEDGSVLARLDENGVHVPGTLSSDCVSARRQDGSRSACFIGDETIPLEFVAEDDSTIAKVGLFGFESKELTAQHLNLRSDAQGDMSRVISDSIQGSGLREINHMILLGRSLAVGRGFTRYRNTRYKNGRATLKADGDVNGVSVSKIVGFQDFNPTGPTTDGERYHYVAADHVMSLLERKKRIDPMQIGTKFMVSLVAYGGTEIDGLISLCPPNVEHQIATAKETFEALGYKYRFAGFSLTHRDDYNYTAQEYHDKFVEFISLCREAAGNATGESPHAIPVFVAPWGYSGINPYDCAQSVAIENDENLHKFGIVASGQSAQDPDGAGVHPSGHGTMEVGMQLGRSWYKYFIENKDPSGLKPISVTAIGNKITVKTNRNNLVVRTTNAVGTTDRYTDSNSATLGMIITDTPPLAATFNEPTKIAITNINLVNDSIVITAASTIPDGYYLGCSGSEIAHNLDSNVYAEQDSDGVELSAYDSMTMFYEEIVCQG